MSTTKKIDLTNSNYGSVKGNSYQMAILPWGATEPHNYHLPYLTDSILSHAISVDTATRVSREHGINVMVLPAVNCGAQNPGQHDLPFCIHYSYETQKAILSDTVRALKHQGINKLLIVNGHGGNIFKGMIRDLYITYPDFLIATTEWFTVVNSKDYFDATIDDHAGESETSVMMYYHPDKVNISEAGDGSSKPFALDSLNDKSAWIPRNWSKTSSDSGVGDPRGATAQKGAKFAGAIVEKLSILVVELATQDIY